MADIAELLLHSRPVPWSRRAMRSLRPARDRTPRRWGAAAARMVGPGLVLCSSAALQVSAAVAVSVFAALGSAATSGLRFLTAAVVLLAVARPRLGDRSRRTWVVIVAFGVVLAAMNVVFYLAADRVPLGTVVTVEFLGPLVVAAAGARRLREMAWVLLAGVGVAMLAGPTVSASTLGLVFAGLGGVGLAGYVLLSQAVGSRTDRFDGLALSTAVAAVLTLPLSVPALPALTAVEFGKVSLSAVLGIVLAFTLEMQAIRRSSAKTVSVLLSLDPAFAALAGLVLLGQQISVLIAGGIGCVVIAGIGVSADPRDPPSGTSGKRRRL